MPPVPAHSVQATAEAPFRQPGLDLLRLVAFGMVFAHHVLPRTAEGYADWAPPVARLFAVLANAGGFGLPLFFFISAYLIATLLRIEHDQDGSIDLRAFYTRRTLRIAPLYLVGLAIGIAWTNRYDGGTDLPMFASYLVLAGNGWFQTHGWSLNPMTQLWSMSVEEQFYLVFPTIFLLAGPRRLPLAGLLIVVASLLALIAQGAAHRAIDTAIWTATPSQTIFLGAGILFACATHGRRIRLDASTRRMLAATAVVLLIAAAGATDAKRLGDATSGLSLATGYALVALACALLMAAVVDMRRRIPAALLYGGRISFGLYVFHLLALHAARWLVGDAPLVVPFIALALAVGAAALSHEWIERPFMAIGRRPQTQLRSRPTLAS